MYEQHQEILESIVALVNTTAANNGLELDVERDAHDQVSIASFRWCDEVVAVRVVDPESKDLKLTMLDKNGCIVGQMSTSNLPLHVAAAAIVDHLALTI